MIQLSVIFVLFCGSIVQASEKIWSRDRSSYVVRQDDHGWHAEVYQVDKEGFSDRTLHELYPDEDAAISAMDQIRPVSSTLESGFQYFSPGVIQSAKVLWPSKNQWSKSWEDKFSDWMKINVKVDFFSQHGIATDCADAAYAYRWIFARINQLPVANKMAGSGNYISNESMRSRWLKYPTANNWEDDQRFLAALDDLLNTTYTHTLMRDSYPIAIDPKTFTVGIHHLSLGSVSGHTYLVSQVETVDAKKIPLYVLSSTVPKAVRKLREGVFANGAVEKKSGGFLRFRWPKRDVQGNWQLVEAQKMPAYSLMQYDPAFAVNERGNFALAVMKRLNPKFDPMLQMKANVAQIYQSLKERVSIVRDGILACQKEDCKPGTEGYENWSTPSRDGRLRKLISDTEKMAASNQFGMGTYWKKQQNKTVLNLFGETIRLRKIVYLFTSEFYGSDPRLTERQRWNTHYADLISRAEADFAEWIPLRNEKILHNTCGVHSLCAVESKPWAKFNTYELDGKLQRLYSSLKYYCNYAGLLECSSFEELMLKKRLFSRLSNTRYFISNPNKTARDGTHLNNTMEIKARISGTSQFGNILAVQSAGGARYYDVTTRKEIEIPKTFSSVTLDPSGTLFVGQNKITKATELFTLATNKVSKVISAKGVAAVWVAKKTLLVYNSVEAILIVFKNGKSSISLLKGRPQTVLKSIYLSRSEDGKTILHDFSSVVPKIIEFNLTNIMGYHSVEKKAEAYSLGYFSCARNVCSGKRDLLLPSGEILQNLKFSIYQSFSDDWHLIRKDSALQLVQFNSRYDIITSSPVNSMFWLRSVKGSDQFLVRDNSGRVKVMQYTGAGKTKEIFRADGVSSISGEYLIVRATNGSEDLINYKTGEKVYSAYKIKPYSYYYATYPGVFLVAHDKQMKFVSLLDIKKPDSPLLESYSAIQASWSGQGINRLPGPFDEQIFMRNFFGVESMVRSIIPVQIGLSTSLFIWR